MCSSDLMPGPNPKEVTKFQQDIKKRKEQIEKTAQLTKKWGKLTGPMTPVDEKTLASGAHGVHGKVHYEKAVETLNKNLTQARNELAGVEAKLNAEQAKK